LENVQFGVSDSKGAVATNQVTLSITNVNGINTLPNTYDITDITNAAIGSTVTTNTITVGGINTQVTASTTLGTLVINGTNVGANSTTVINGDTVAITATASGANSTTLNGVLTIGTGTDNFAVITVAALDTVPPVIS